ncbi:5-formyltetrahydrofolate cyclo-ligase [Candidatus Poribacteria bacterium]|nr:MAG: 5-formyltetrahydrofolate cyclo-ligase [Candidatus Poribacteria bacterium]
MADVKAREANQMNQKQERERLRGEVLRKRDSIPLSVRTELSRRIVHHAINWIEVNRADAVLIYLSMRSEVETGDLLNYLLAQNKIALAPVMRMKQRDLTPYRIMDAKEDLVLHPYGMYQPNNETCPSFPLNQIDLIFVPGVAFDLRGYRIGYGAGFYDRFLPQCPQAVWIGLAYEAQIVTNTFPQPWDVPLHQILTEAA